MENKIFILDETVITDISNEIIKKYKNKDKLLIENFKTWFYNNQLWCENMFETLNPPQEVKIDLLNKIVRSIIARDSIIIEYEFKDIKSVINFVIKEIAKL